MTIEQTVVHALWDHPFGPELAVHDGVVGVENQLKRMHDDTLSAPSIQPSPEHCRRP
ncbi:hypothetical protein [Kribbella sp. NPDC048928]|uniref:hypothetical protein n=1 Tax=Kribbella sp. NPDC048928 TaxID=3364111 RepID=UPI003716795E